MQEKLFAGMDGFLWWVGVVESRQDPLGLGRVKVRVFGIHSDSLTDIPTNDLPWATVMHSGNDRSFATPREADYVFGFFVDGRSGQNPIVMGVLPGYFTQPADQGSGFHDLRTLALLKTSPRKPVSRTYNKDGTGINLTEIDLSSNTALAGLRHPTAEEKDRESISGVVRGQALDNTVIQARKSSLDKAVVTAGGAQWDEPAPAYNPLYPYNSANETESGHVFELDDTPGNERIHIAHRNGSFIEWYPSGTRVEKITKSKYEIIMGDDHVHIMGKVQITIQGDAAIRVVGDCNIQAEGNLGMNVASDMDVSVGGDLNFKAKNVNVDAGSGDFTVVSASAHLTPSGDFNVKSGGGVNLQGGGSINIKGTTVINDGSVISLNGSVLVQGGINRGAFGASGASGGSAKGLPAAVGKGTPNRANIPDEVAPTPLVGSLIKFDPETGLAFRQAQFLAIDPTTGATVDPGNDAKAVANTIAASNASPCMFDITNKTFITSDQWQLSTLGTTFIQTREAFFKSIGPDMCIAYPDPATGGEPLTIGYGCTAPGIGQPVPAGLIWTRAQAFANLQIAVTNTCLPILKRRVTVPLTQNMVDALISLIYNIGSTNFGRPTCTLVKKLNQSDWCGAADQFLVWNKANHGTITVPGLTTRRKLERTLFLS